MWAMASVMGTEGKRAVASYETIFSLGFSFNFLIFPTNSVEFLQIYSLFWTKGLRISLRSEAGAA